LSVSDSAIAAEYDPSKGMAFVNDSVRKKIFLNGYVKIFWLLIESLIFKKTIS